MIDTRVSSTEDNLGKLPEYLFRQTSGIYRYRRRVPDALKGQVVDGVQFPANEWLQSLGTRDPVEARTKHAELGAQLDSQIAEAELILTGPSGLTEAARIREDRLAREAFEAKQRERRLARAPLRAALKERMHQSTAELTPEEAAMVDVVREAKEARAEDVMAATATVRAGTERIAGKTLGDAIAFYTEHRVANKKGSTQKSNGTAFAFLIAVLGESARLPQITRDDARKALAMLHRQPSAQWAGKGLSIYERASLAEKEGLPCLSSKTIRDSYLSFWGALFRYAVQEEWTARNVFDGLTVEVAGRKTEKRFPYSDSDLTKLFAAEPWTPPTPLKDELAIRYWGPLIALFHGLRRGEIAQLDATKFQVQNDVMMFEVTGDVKNRNAKRKLALHPELIRLGLFAFAQQRSSHGLLFEGQAADRRSIWGDAFGDWFGRHRKKLGVGQRGQGLHALRHNFEDALREAELHQTAIGQYLAGRKAVDQVGANYGAGDSAQRLFEAINKVRYPMLSFEPA